MGKKIVTKYGSCFEDKDGYWVVSSRKEGNKNKRLHRLIWEEHYGIIPNNHIIHHKDGNVKNNNREKYGGILNGRDLERYCSL